MKVLAKAVMVMALVGLCASVASAAWTYTETFTDPAWYSGGAKWGGNYMVAPVPGPGWTYSTGTTGGFGVVYPEPRGITAVELYCVQGGYEQAANLQYHGIPFDNQGSVTFSWFDGYSGSSMNFRLMDAAGTTATRFWVSTQYGERQVWIQNDDVDYVELIQYTDPVRAGSGDRLFTTISWDNVANTVSVSSYNAVSGATSPVRTAPMSLRWGDVDITAVEFNVNGYSSGNGSEWQFGAEGITFTSTPEPASMLLLAAGCVGLLKRRTK